MDLWSRNRIDIVLQWKTNSHILICCEINSVELLWMSLIGSISYLLMGLRNTHVPYYYYYYYHAIYNYYT